MAKYVVAPLAEVPPGGRKIVEIAGRSVGVFNLDGEIFALRNRCPHQGGPLCTGRLSGFLQAAVPGEYNYSRKGEVLRCPWHGWEFDVRTGLSWFDPVRTRVRSYEARVAPGTALIAEAEAPGPGLVQGPYVAETYQVSVEEDYILVEIPG
jgi:nitrite reductase/ring-hydroxylating ferredoxin subunit